MSEKSEVSQEVIKGLDGSEDLKELVRRPSIRKTPSNVKAALNQGEEDIDKYRRLADEIRREDLTPLERNDQLVTVINARTDTERLGEQIRTEFGLPPKRKVARQELPRSRR